MPFDFPLTLHAAAPLRAMPPERAASHFAITPFSPDAMRA